MRLSDQAMKAYEDHCAENGKPDSHAKAKEVLAGFAGAFIDREFETKGVSRLSTVPSSWPRTDYLLFY